MKPFEDINLGDALEEVEFGPLSIEDTVRWAGIQENSEHVHWDREFARENCRLPTFIASGAYRQALLARMLTDWVGVAGRLRKLSVRHVAPTFEGDMMRYRATIVEKSDDPNDRWVACEVQGVNQKNDTILFGRCVMSLPSRG